MLDKTAGETAGYRNLPPPIPEAVPMLFSGWRNWSPTSAGRNRIGPRVYLTRALSPGRIRLAEVIYGACQG
jgi:hypothetical protein